ncbi:hypothetical protein [Paenibacillus segetis]|uniref:Uncharacterized protein n=1 Tax=Paenibacillus segetis TaxID=1325360 RepID=A0ABQ1Y8P2_9BACL|nr:hypothetical protein [Paenibacillus segetis]GGH16896.1 hypothetical protein GCM10008013_11990 [Paenibacillus segetis]
MEKLKQQEQQQIENEHKEDFKIKTVDDILKFYGDRSMVNSVRSS